MTLKTFADYVQETEDKFYIMIDIELARLIANFSDRYMAEPSIPSIELMIDRCYESLEAIAAMKYTDSFLSHGGWKRRKL